MYEAASPSSSDSHRYLGPGNSTRQEINFRAIGRWSGIQEMITA
jgi:hypothetical protein